MNEFAWSEKDLSESLEKYNNIYYQAVGAEIEERVFSQKFTIRMKKLIRQSDYSPFMFNIFVKAIPRYRKAVAAFAAVCICIFMMMPVLAANVPTIYDLMYLVSPATAQYFMPIRESHESNGIKMEVVSTHIQDNAANVYITLQDLTDDRVDATIDLFDSYSIRSPSDYNAHCQFVGYEDDTKTATFLIHITGWGERNIKRDKITFSLKNFLSDKKVYEDMPIDIDLNSINNSTDIKNIHPIGGGNSNTLSDVETVLVPSNNIFSPVDGFNITGIGFIENKLHVQIAAGNILQNDNQVFMSLKDKDGNVKDCDYSIGFIEYTDPDNFDTRIDYTEFVFDIPQDEIANYKLYGSFYTSGKYTEGDWQVTFPLLGGEDKK